MSVKIQPRDHRRLHSDERRKIEDPAKLVQVLNIFAGIRLADVGCGSGFFTLEFAKALTQGRVWAVDVSREMLDLLEGKLKRQGLANVQSLLSQEDKIPLPDDFVDAAVCTHVLHEVDHPALFMKEVARIIKEGGNLLMVDWQKGVSTPWGPPQEERIAQGQALALMKEAGFEGMESFKLYPFHYVIKAMKAKADAGY